MARREKGQDLVEFAVVVPILLILVLGIFEVGRFVHAYLIVTGAAGDGARYASMTAGDTVNDPEVIAAVKQIVFDRTNELGDWVTLRMDDIHVTWENGTATPGNPIRVTVDYDVELFTSGFLNLPPLTASAFNEMVIYQ